MINYSKIIYSAATIFMVGLFIFTIVHADTTIQDTSGIILSPQLIEKSLFKENEQSSVVVRPRFNDGSTNVAFYLDIDGTMWWQAEQLGSLGDLPFSGYWEPTSAIGKYVAVEYFNDQQQFGCAGLSLNECIANPHFISQFSFEIVDNNAIIPVPVPQTIDIIDSGAIPNTATTTETLSETATDTATSTSTSTPAPVIQNDGDGSTTVISI